MYMYMCVLIFIKFHVESLLISCCHDYDTKHKLYFILTVTLSTIQSTETHTYVCMQVYV